MMTCKNAHPWLSFAALILLTELRYSIALQGIGPISNSRGSCCMSMGVSFDFSSPSEWDTFYQEQPEVLEWHSNVPLEQIATYVSQDADVLLVGCGNSRLPGTILSNCKNAKLVLLDTSKTCLDQLETSYGSSVEYVCGNAVDLDSIFHNRQFDIVIDKGLSDALLCSEGWDGPVERLYRGAAKILRPANGRYLLVSYKLPSSTQGFLRDVGDSVGLEWDFDLKGISEHRVGVSLATRRID